jgi:hypothetical protein
MSKPQKINDYGGYPHTADMSMKSKNRLKEYTSAEGSGNLPQYDETTEDIKRDQLAGDAKVKAHPMKPGYRN